MRKTLSGISATLTACMLFLLLVTYALAGSGECAVDALVTPKIDRTEITVGGADADIPGFTSRAIQIALDAVKVRGAGGTVRLGPGVYDIMGPVRLSSNVELIGAGEETVLRKSDGIKRPFVIDADYGMVKVTVNDSKGFEVGMGIQVYDDRWNGGYLVSTAIITSIDGNTLFFDRGLILDYKSDSGGIVSNASSIVEGVDVENCRIADLVIDGNKETNDSINGCRAGGVYLFRVKDVTVENVTVRNYNGDSFSWQITENIVIRNCEAKNGTLVGFHPGTGSDNSAIENCRSHHNGTDGIFLCWRVQNGTIRNNELHDNGRHGLSIGHKDSDNIFLMNRIYGNSRHGVYFRPENEQNAGNRNSFTKNVIEDNGRDAKDGYGFYIDGVTKDIVIEDNIIRDNGGGSQIGAVFIGENASCIVEKKNTISGHKAVVEEKE